MINQIITNIKQDLSQILTPDQMEALSRTLNKHLPMLTVEKAAVESIKNDMLPLFIAAKRVEGCSEKSLRYNAYNAAEIGIIPNRRNRGSCATNC